VVAKQGYKILMILMILMTTRPILMIQNIENENCKQKKKKDLQECDNSSSLYDGSKTKVVTNENVVTREDSKESNTNSIFIKT